MKVGNIVSGLEVVDVKRINKLNLIQFLKEVDNYLQKGYQIDVNSARQVGLVLQADMYKTEAAFGGVGSVGCDESTDVASTEAQVNTDVSSTDVNSVEPELETEKVEGTSLEEPVVEDTVEPVESTTKEEAPKKTTTRTRSKKTTQ